MSPWMADEINFWLALSTGFDCASAPVAANAPASATASIAVVLLIIAPKVPFACVVYGEASAIKTAGVQCLFLVGLLEHISAFNRPQPAARRFSLTLSVSTAMAALPAVVEGIEKREMENRRQGRRLS